MQFQIKENSFIARIAAWKLRSTQIAIVIGNTIHLHNTSRGEFLSNECWLNHEMEHIRQYRKHGFIPFVVSYLIESLTNGYFNNKYEVAARAAENGNLPDGE
ncbi:MAG: DUF4157 domain-containing protein [Chitinophagaceae bacterium]|nr:DUF4157 domain-containing protein [Chitinophagaceae bacterium]